MKTISTDDLDLVTGGAAASSQSSTSNDQLMTSLQSIQRSLEDLGKQQQGGLFGGNNTMLLFTMAIAMQRRPQVVVFGGRGCRRW